MKKLLPLFFLVIPLSVFGKEAEIQFNAKKLSSYSDNEVQVLILYGRWLINCISPHYKHTLECEVESREEEAKYWQRLNKNGPPSSYFDELVTIYENGFMTEYVWKYHRQTNWNKPSSLRQEEFEQWAIEKIPNHKPLIDPPLNVVIE